MKWARGRLLMAPVRTMVRHFVPRGVYNTLMGRDPLGLCYHIVSPQRLEHVIHLLPYKTPEMFESDLLYLKKHFHPIDYEQLAQHRVSGKAIPRRSVFLSFDDGYAECFDVVRPLLLKHDVPCTFFVVTDFVDNEKLFYRNEVSLCVEAVSQLEASILGDVLEELGALVGRTFDDRSSFVRWLRGLEWRDGQTIDRVAKLLDVDLQRFLSVKRPYLTSSHVKQLASDGFTVGAHGTNHRRLSNSNQGEIEREITDSCLKVREWTGSARIPFAFPFSAEGIDRGWLERVLLEHPFVGLLFDAWELKRDRDFIVSRVLADWPPNSDGRRSNVPELWRDTYARVLLSGLRTRATSISRLWRTWKADRENDREPRRPVKGRTEARSGP
jgi:peptidoglycan/xylan/chitin deacetylase (PgdA/CDA1 family)